MEENQFSRTLLLIGEPGLEKLKNAKVAVFGLGGVGSYVVEALVRSGVQNFVLVDKDVVSLSNINRQIIATHNTVGRLKLILKKKEFYLLTPLQM